MAVVRPYRGVSAEDRRADRRDRLLDAGLDVLGSEGVAGTTMKAVCARAGLTERYFYESFKDLDELLLAVMDACMWAIDDAVEAASAAAPNDLLERSRAATRALIETLTEDPRRARVYVEAVGSDALRERQARGVRAYARRLAELMRECMELPATHKGEARAGDARTRRRHHPGHRELARRDPRRLARRARRGGRPAVRGGR